MADKDNENLDATTTESVDAQETVSEDASSEDASVEAIEPSEAAPEELVAEESSAEEAPAEEVPATDDLPEEIVNITTDEKTPAQIIESFEASQLKDDIPSFRPGDTVVVLSLIHI